MCWARHGRPASSSCMQPGLPPKAPCKLAVSHCPAATHLCVHILCNMGLDGMANQGHLPANPICFGSLYTACATRCGLVLVHACMQAYGIPHMYVTAPIQRRTASVQYQQNFKEHMAKLLSWYSLPTKTELLTLPKQESKQAPPYPGHTLTHASSSPRLPQLRIHQPKPHCKRYPNACIKTRDKTNANCIDIARAPHVCKDITHRKAATKETSAQLIECFPCCQLPAASGP